MADAASSSRSNSTRKKYHVFISFRGKDTRKTFTSHLYHALSVKKIYAYIDEENLEKGDEISPALLEAITESEISVIVLSKDYASSRWCLDELNQIVQCKESNNQIIVPVFYGVNPSDVRKQEGSYASAFAALEDRFKDHMHKVQQWRNSLTTVANLAGFDSSNFGSDSELLEAILEDISKNLNCLLPPDELKDLVGIEERIQHVESLLNIDLLDVHIIGIWGMGGIGKTTLADVIYKRYANQFEGHYFLENVKENSKKLGLPKLQKKLFSKILLEEKGLNVVNQFVKDRLRRTKVLIVLDDVDDAEQLKYLVGGRDWFGRGSKIIITTRDKQVLECMETVERYEVEKLNFSESLHLFCSKAFRKGSPKTDYIDLLQRFINYAKGIPLALKVLGNHLCSKSIKQWDSELVKLEKNPKKEVDEVLRLSYDGLERNEKDIFLDIACFFKSRERDYVKRVLEAYGTRYMDAGIQTLIDKALITITFDQKLEMHDLMQEMGREIIRQESKNPGKRSRLWSAEDISEVLANDIGTRAIQGISLETLDLREAIRLNPEVFKKMYNLKYLKIHNCQGKNYLQLPEGLKSLPDELRYFYWDFYPLKSLPLDFKPQNLIELNLSKSKLEYLWNGEQNFVNLKVLNLYASKNLIQIPDLSRALKLEDIKLACCTSLQNLPSNISKLESLQALILSYCSNINEFPELPVNIKRLYMEETSIEQVPSSIDRLFHLQTLYLGSCSRLKSLPTTIFKLKSLKYLLLNGCLRLEHLPEISGHLTMFQIKGTGIRELPSSIKNLTGLRRLDLMGCKNLKSIPDDIYNMQFELINLSGCLKLQSFPDRLSTGLLFLKTLNLDHTNVSEIPDWFFHLPLLRHLSLCKTRIRTIPASIKSSKLCELYITECESLQSLPELPVRIKEVHASGCTSLQTISNALTEPQSISFSNRATEFKEEPWSYSEYYIENLIFNDCLVLDHHGIITEFQIRALRLHFLPRWKEIQFQPSNVYFNMYISFPGNEIPKWFNHQNDKGCSIDMKLPPQYHDTTNFMGFASCVVVAPELNGEIPNSKVRIHYFKLECDVNVQTNDGQRSFTFDLGLCELTMDSSNHMLMWYFQTNQIDLVTVKEVSFVFRTVLRQCSTSRLFRDQYPNPFTYKVERCGIRMLQLQDAVDFGIINTEFIHLESNAVTSELQPSGPETVNLGTTEPPPKRAKHSSLP